MVERQETNRYCDNNCEGHWTEAKRYGVDEDGKPVDLCEACYQQLGLLIRLGVIKKPLIDCSICGTRVSLSLDDYNRVSRDLRGAAELRFLCKKCSGELYLHGTGFISDSWATAWLPDIVYAQSMKKAEQK
jgi:predicted SprT family Zn-dependent metalloprotease